MQTARLPLKTTRFNSQERLQKQKMKFTQKHVRESIFGKNGWHVNHEHHDCFAPNSGKLVPKVNVKCWTEKYDCMKRLATSVRSSRICSNLGLDLILGDILDLSGFLMLEKCLDVF